MTQPDNTQWLDELEVEFLHGVPVKLPDAAKQSILSCIQANFIPKPEDGRIYLDIDLVKRDWTPNSEVERLERQAQLKVIKLIQANDRSLWNNASIENIRLILESQHDKEAK